MLFIFFLIYLIIFGHLASVLLKRFFSFGSVATTTILGMFLVCITGSWIGGVALIFFTWQPMLFAGVLVLNGLLYVPALRYKNNKQDPNVAVRQHEIVPMRVGAMLGSVLFVVCVLYAFFLLFNSRTSGNVFSPWQIISPQYIYVFFISTCIAGLLIFSSLKTKTVLMYLVVQTLLLHSYLPLSHVLPYGADAWRHIANEQQFLGGGTFLEAKLSAAQTNSALSKIGQLSYGSFWAATIMAATFFNTSIIEITKWFLPVIWSLIFPVLLFEIARTIGIKEKQALFFSWLGLLPFAWQAAGSFSLPVNMGFLIFLFGLLLIVHRLNRPASAQVVLLGCYGIGMVCGYSLYGLLFWLFWLVAEIVMYLSVRGISSRLVSLVMAAIMAVIIPVIEIITNYSHFDGNVQLFGQIKQIVGNFFGIYIASGPRPHDIAFGNIIFNQIPLTAFVSNIFLVWRWWIVALMVIFFALVVRGIKEALQSKQMVHVWLFICGLGIVGGYGFSNYILTGEHILARRLDALVAFILIVYCFYGLRSVLEKKVILVAPLVLVFSFATAASYALGPDTYTMSADQYQAAQYIWDQEKDESASCVLANTYSLLALEAVSSKRIIGGGFPIDANFGQPERAQLLDRVSSGGIDSSLLNDIGALTGADHCWFVGQTAVLQRQKLENLKTFNTISTVKFNITF